MKPQIIIAIIIIVGVVTYLIFTSLSQTMVYYMTVSEFINNPPERGCRINGKVVKGSIEHQPNTFDYNFRITDGKNELPVYYKGVVSDIFQDDIEVVVEGKYQKNSTMFQAKELITKCPSKYVAQEGSKPNPHKTKK